MLKGPLLLTPSPPLRGVLGPHCVPVSDVPPRPAEGALKVAQDRRRLGGEGPEAEAEPRTGREWYRTGKDSRNSSRDEERRPRPLVLPLWTPVSPVRPTRDVPPVVAGRGPRH